MSKYIDVNKLIAEIERLNSLVSYESKDRHDDGLHDAYKAVKNVIASLQQEQPEVDLEKEIDNYLSCSEDIEECADNEHYYVTKSALLSMARYFFIHGCLNARKEE